MNLKLGSRNTNAILEYFLGNIFDIRRRSENMSRLIASQVGHRDEISKLDQG